MHVWNGLGDEKRNWENRQERIMGSSRCQVTGVGLCLKVAGTWGVSRSEQSCLIKWRTVVIYIFLQSTRSANELVLFRTCVDLGIIWEAGHEWVMRCPGGSPKTTSWHCHWRDLERREKLGPRRPAQRLLWWSVERCCELDSDGGHGHVERQVSTHSEVGRATSL